MKLAFVSDFYYPSIGGTQMLCKGIAEWFKAQGNEIEIITSPDQDREDLGYVVNELRGASLQGQTILLENKYDAVFVLADLFSPSILSMKPIETKKSILILNLDENVYNWIKQGRIKDVDRRIEAIKRFDHVVSFCQGAPVNKFLDENNIEHHFIPNFSRDVMNGPKSDKITKEALGINKKIIFNHGLVENRKNQLALIKAFESSNLPDDYHLVLLGSPRGASDHSYFLQCKALADKNDSITMVKGTNNQIVINTLLSISDVYVLPSTAEGLPLVLLEAMSSGLPWVSTPVGGVPAVFGSLQGGKVMNGFDLSDLEKSIREVENRNSRKDWEAQFNVDRAGNQYNSLLTKQTNRKSYKLLNRQRPIININDTIVSYHPTPKCACSTVKSILNYCLTEQDPEDFEDLHKIFITTSFIPFSKADLRICVVRDPVERFVSGYSNRVAHHKDIPYVEFDKFLENFNEFYKEPMIAHHFAKQIDFIGTDPDYYTHIFWTHEVDQLSSMLAELSGIQIPAFRKQTGGSNQKPELTEQQIDKIKQLYLEDYNFIKKMENK